MGKPAQPRVLSGRYDRTSDRLAVNYRSGSLAAGCFLLLWLTGWTVGCVALAYAAFVERKPGLLLFGVPFWAAEVFVVFTVIAAIFGREYLTLDADGITFGQTALVSYSRKFVPLTEMIRFSSCVTATDSESALVMRGIELHSRGLPLQFGSNLPAPEREWLIAELNEQLEALRRLYALPGETQQDAKTVVFRRSYVEPTSSDTLMVVRTADARTEEPPHDCRWRRFDEFDAMAFESRGAWSFGAVGVLLFINLFWNGIVGVFVSLLWGLGGFADGPARGEAEWWGLFLFLIPFEVIGLGMFGGLLFTLLEPLRRSRWRFAPSEIYYRISWLGLGPRWRYPFERLDRLEVQRGEPGEKRGGAWFKPANVNAARRVTYSLVVVDDDNHEICTIGDLSLGESLWMADSLLRNRILPLA